MANPTSFIRKLLELRLFLIINLVVLFFLSLSFGREYVRNASIENDIQDLKEEKAQLESRNLELLSLGQTIQTQFFLEKEGRLKYGLRKPGEELVIVSDTSTAEPSSDDANQAPSSTSSTLSTSSTSPETSNPTRWWYFFFNRTAYENLTDQYGG